MPTDNKKLCPDGGTCHHDCNDQCWRVGACGPLSGVYPDDDWPADVMDEHAPGQRKEEAQQLIDTMDKMAIELRQKYQHSVIFCVVQPRQSGGCDDALATVEPEHAGILIEMLEEKIEWLRRISKPCSGCGRVESAGHGVDCPNKDK